MKTIYYGDSITEGFILLKQNKNVINKGVSGDKIINLLGRYMDIHLENPDQIMIMIGINDYLCSKDYWQAHIHFDIKTLFTSLIDLIQTNLPKTNITVLSILPVSMDVLEPTLSTFNKDIIEINKLYQSISKEKNISYIDIHKDFLKDNILDPKYTYDGVHLSELGYEHYYNLIKHLL